MKKLRLTIAVLVAIAFLPLASAQGAGNPSLQVNKENRTITVFASDHAEADPDVADIHIGFTTYGIALKTAYKSASDTSSAIIKAITDAGAKSSEIQSQNQNVSRLNDYEIKEQKGMRYSVQQSWTVSVSPKEAAIVLDAAVQAGANQSGDITWRLKNNTALDTEAIHRATQKARTIAREIASSLDLKLGQPIYITNTMSLGDSFPVNSLARMSPGAMKMNAAPAPLSIQTQRVESNATVQIVFAIE
jgi:uncharacterized protein YggE